VLALVRRAPAVVELIVLLGICVPVVYAASWALAFVLRRTPLSLLFTGRPQARRKGPCWASRGSRRMLACAASLSAARGSWPRWCSVGRRAPRNG
jgi:hypothetical protein